MFIESMNQPITNWLNLNYMASKDGSIPRCIIYQHYCSDFKKEGIEPLNTAMFGKVIKMVFPFIRSRRLGNRGNSKYHYFGIAVRSTLPSPVLEQEAMPENIFLQCYEKMHCSILNKFLSRGYIEAYQEIKVFWSKWAGRLVHSSYLDKTCLAIEKKFFKQLVKKYFVAKKGNLLKGEEESPENIAAAKNVAKTIIVLCKQVLGATACKNVFLRMESYKQQAILLNALGNLSKCIAVLEVQHRERASLDHFLALLKSGACFMMESISLDRMHSLHTCAAAIVTLYISSSSFTEFACSMEVSNIAVLCKREGALYEEMQMYFTGAMQEVTASRPPSFDFSSVLCAFFSEYFCLVGGNVAVESLLQRSPTELRVVQTSEAISFVSQIITS